MFGKTVLDIPSLASACGFHYGSNNDFTKHYHIFIQVGLTGTENGQEEYYMSLDLVADIASLDDQIEFEVLSLGVM